MTVVIISLKDTRRVCIDGGYTKQPISWTQYTSVLSRYIRFANTAVDGDPV